MARRSRFSPGGIAYHVMNRTWGKIDLFEDAGDYEAFERVLAEARQREPEMAVCCYCLMPNHFHLVLWPRRRMDQLSRFMQWLTMTHTQRWHAHRHSAGRGPPVPEAASRAFRSSRMGISSRCAGMWSANALRARLVEKASSGLGARWRRASERLAEASVNYWMRGRCGGRRTG